MNKRRAKRLTSIIILLCSISIAIGLILYSLKQNINLFLTPSALLATALPEDKIFRLGGQVKPGSLKKDKQTLSMHFILTDLSKEVMVVYKGIPPDLFREGSGAIAEGHWDSHQKQFVAFSILAKHDENYKPSVRAYP